MLLRPKLSSSLGAVIIITMSAHIFFNMNFAAFALLVSATLPICLSDSGTHVEPTRALDEDLGRPSSNEPERSGEPTAHAVCAVNSLFSKPQCCGIGGVWLDYFIGFYCETCTLCLPSQPRSTHLDHG